MEENKATLLGEMGLLPTPQSSDWRTKRTSKSWKKHGSTNRSLANDELWEQHADEIEQARAKIKFMKGGPFDSCSS